MNQQSSMLLSQSIKIFAQKVTFISIDMQPCVSKSNLWPQQTTINTILLFIRKNKISLTEGISPICWRVELRFYQIQTCIKDKGIKLSQFVHKLNSVRQFKPLLFRQHVNDCFAVFRSADHVLCVWLRPFKAILTHNIEICFVVGQRIVVFYLS